MVDRLSNSGDGAGQGSDVHADKERRLSELLDRWQEAGDQGTDVPIGELCRDFR